MSLRQGVRPSCGHRKCRAATWALIGGGIGLYASLPFLLTMPLWKCAVIFGASAAALIAGFTSSCPGDDIEALVKAVREDIPDHVPAEWVKHL